MWNAAPLGGGEATHTDYMLTMEWNIAFVMAWYPCIGAITRITRGQAGSMWGLWFGYGVLMCLYIFIGVATAYAAVSLGASPTGDPTEYLLAIGGPWLGSLALALVGFANITTAAVGVYSMSISTKLLFPTLGYKWIALFYSLLVCGLWLWGGVMTYYTTFLAYGAIVCGAGVTLLVVDYWIVRRRKLHLHSLYERGQKGRYWYTAASTSSVWPRSAAARSRTWPCTTPSPMCHGSQHLQYLHGTGLLVLVTGGVYLLLSLLPPVRRYLMADTSVEDRC